MMLYWDKLLTPERFRKSPSVKKTNSDNRSPFKKDFDTICNSTVLRRLQDKAQVFPLEKEDYARTRLTHSIEVMSIASSLAVQAIDVIETTNYDQYLSEDFLSKNVNRTSILYDIPTILNAAALLHDMGNPPFGHLGEQIISDWFRDNLSKISKNSDGTYSFNDVGSTTDTLAYKLKGKYANDLLNIDGNAQLLRLVTKLSFVVDTNGMNLTFPVLATFIKYPCSSSEIDKTKLSTKKAGYYSAEAAAFKTISDALKIEKCRHPLAFLLEAADDIAYLTADIEDAQHKGIISIDYLVSKLREKEEDEVVHSVLEEISRYRNEADALKYNDIDGYIIHRVRIFIKGLMIDAMNDSFKDLYAKIMNGECETELIAHSKVSTLASILREIEKEKIYYSDGIVDRKTRALIIIRKLLDIYVPAVLNYNDSKDYQKDTVGNLIYLSLSENYRYICEKANDQKTEEEILYNKLLLVVDQISGMTDSRAMNVYKTITAT